MHAAQAVICGGEVEVEGIWLLAEAAGLEDGGEVFVEVGKGFDEAFGVAAGQAAGVDGGRAEAVGVVDAGADDLAVAAKGGADEGVGFFLAPVEAAFFAVDADGQAVFFVDGDL